MPWTIIPDGEYAEGQPVRGVTGLAMRDNVSAVANGDTGAPRVQTAGINDAAVTTAKIADANITLAKLASGFTTHYGVGTYIYATPTTSGGDISYVPGDIVPASQITGVSSGSWKVMGTESYTRSSGGSSVTPALLLRIS